MRYLAGLMFCGGLLLATAFSEAQPPGQPPGGKGDKGKGGPGGKGDKGGPGGPGGGVKAMTVEELVARMMSFDANKDGKLTKDEVTDPRLANLIERADAHKDGVVTKDELTALFTKEVAAAWLREGWAWWPRRLWWTAGRSRRGLAHRSRGRFCLRSSRIGSTSRKTRRSRLPISRRTSIADWRRF